MINGQTQLFGILGWPVAHSLSPVMHNAALSALGLNGCFVPLPVPPEQLGEAVRGLAALGFAGASVTAPHKETVLAALDSVDEAAQALGAVNTLVVERDDTGAATVHGHNTDWVGFVRSLNEAGVDLQAVDRAVVVGAGGAARAALYALLQAGCFVTVVNRTYERAKELIIAMDVPEPAEIETSSSGLDGLVRAARAADLLVHATPVGMWPQEEASVWPEEVPVPAHLAVLDMVYHPRETMLLRQARQSGALALSGLGMLVAQGAAALELWTGRPAPVDVMRAACEQVPGAR
jgi:shikimate dehydrogenase